MRKKRIISSINLFFITLCILGQGNISVHLDAPARLAVAGMVMDVPAETVVVIKEVPAGIQAVTVTYGDGRIRREEVTVADGQTAFISFKDGPRGVSPATPQALAPITPQVEKEPTPADSSLGISAPPSPIRGEVFIKGGNFFMGDEKGDLWDACRPVHEQRVSDFWMLPTEVTQVDYKAVMGKNPSVHKGDDLPVDSINWYSAVAFANMLSELDGLYPAYIIHGNDVKCDFNAPGWRLPTEAEWEYAARGGAESKGYKYAGGNFSFSVAWFEANTTSWQKPVAGKNPNELSLYDMSGNVSEWCWDSFIPYASGDSKDTLDPAFAGTRVIRGGSWHDRALFARCAYRLFDKSDVARAYYGLRLVRSAGR